MGKLFSFPNPVNEKAARVVAGAVFMMSIVALVTSSYWLLAVLAAGFVLRVLTGPRIDPLALLAVKVVAPRLGEPKHVAGPPKRFAQGIGAVLSVAGAVLALGFDLTGAADALLVALIVASGLESIFALCLGCRAFEVLMRLGLIPASVCEECADIWSRPGMARPDAAAR